MPEIESFLNVFKKYKKLGDDTLSQLSEEEIFWQPNTSSNSIAIIVKHLHGNMLSRWTDFLTTDGEKPWRNRDAEFENDLPDTPAVTAAWEEGWALVFQVIQNLTPADFGKTIYIRGEAHTVEDALLRQLAHYASHIGQMQYVGKIVRNTEWKSLSIPKGNSGAYNNEMFGSDAGAQK